MSILPQRPGLVYPPVGARFGRLVVEGEETRHNGTRAAPCLCDCGERATPLLSNLLGGRSTSCGCARREYRPTTHGDTGTPLYWVWHAMHGRCRLVTDKNYHNYGGRGITVCAEWRTYEGFRAWANTSGYAPNLEIDRIDTNGSYLPGNCRWITRKANSRNQRRTRFVTIFGETKCIAEWAEDARCAVPKNTFLGRLNRGIEPEKALTTPPTDIHACASGPFRR